MFSDGQSQTPKDTNDTARGMIPETIPPTALSQVRPVRRFALYLLVLVGCFSMPLIDLVRLAAATDLYSHILLIPCVTIYLLWQQRRALAAIPMGSSWLAAPLFFLGLLGIGVHWYLRRHGWQPVAEDYLCLVTLSCYCFAWGGGFLFLHS